MNTCLSVIARALHLFPLDGNYLSETGKSTYEHKECERPLSIHVSATYDAWRVRFMPQRQALLLNQPLPPGAVRKTGIQKPDMHTTPACEHFHAGFATDSLCPGLPTLPSVKRPVPPPRPIPEEIRTEVLAEVTDRTELILRLAAELGLRAGKSHDCARTTSLPHLQAFGTSQLREKAAENESLPVPNKLAAMLRRRSQHIDSHWFFPGRIDGHLSSRYISKLASQALPGTWTLHPLRHRFATVGYQFSHDLLSIRQALGHSSVQTTTRYTASDTTGLISITRPTQLAPSDKRNHTMTVIAICNNKGGTGNTTSPILLATYFSTLGKRLLFSMLTPKVIHRLVTACCRSQ